MKFYKILFLIFIINIFYIFLVLLQCKKVNNNCSIDKSILYIENDTFDLFLKNKTEFYYVKRKNYLMSLNQTYNESNLLTIQDKLNYLLIHESPEYKSNIVDKIKLSEYSKKILGKDICIPILKIYGNAEEINLTELPNKFVLKCNHGSSFNIFCEDKNKFNFTKAKYLLNKWMNTNFGTTGNEFQYHPIKKKIFASPHLGKLIDYKTYCFNGKPKYIAVRVISNSTKYKCIYNYYDLNWTITDIELGRRNYKREPNAKIERPKNLKLLIKYAEKLSKEFVFVRVDFYEINNKLYLGELTFSPSNNIMPFKNQEQRIYLGNLLNVTKIKSYLYIIFISK